MPNWQLLSKSFFGLGHANYRLPEWQASCKTDFLCTLSHSSNIILFLYFNLHFLKIDFTYLQNDSLVLTFSGHHIQLQLRFCQKLTNFMLTPCLAPSVHPEQVDFCTGQGPFQAHKQNVLEFKVHSRAVRCTPIKHGVSPCLSKMETTVSQRVTVVFVSVKSL